MLWDIFCKVIDNHGDIGVCWRLSVQLAARGERVRLWVDDPSALAWMAPGGNPQVQVLPWEAQARALQPGEVVIEAFGCELMAPFQAAMAGKTGSSGRQPVWINLEYLTAEPFAERNHGLPSPVFAGPAAGLTKHFFYPGVTERTGGLLREDDLMQRQARFDPAAWLRGLGIPADDGAARVSLFCYEPALLPELLVQFAAGPDRTRLFVTPGRAAAAVRAAIETTAARQPSWNGNGLLAITWLPLLSQIDFDHLLWACELNLVRGEDSLVRALWAGKPLVWQIYPQHDQAHHAKLNAFLDWLEAPTSLREFHHGWNGMGQQLPMLQRQAWAEALTQARQRLLMQDSLVSQLMFFANRLLRASS
jgi:uncharacterized repeat protein (TIGR03837 family)